MADVILLYATPNSWLKKNISSRQGFAVTESVIREMTRQATLYGCGKSGAGVSGFRGSGGDQAGRRGRQLEADVNQYAITWGAKKFAQTRLRGRWACGKGFAVDPEKEVTVCCGSTEAMISTLLAVCNVGDEW